MLWKPAAGEHGIEMQPVVSIPLAGDAATGRAALDSVPPFVYGGASGPARVVVALPANSVLRRALVLERAVQAPDLAPHRVVRSDQHRILLVASRKRECMGIEPTRPVICRSHRF